MQEIVPETITVQGTIISDISVLQTVSDLIAFASEVRECNKLF